MVHSIWIIRGELRKETVCTDMSGVQGNHMGLCRTLELATEGNYLTRAEVCKLWSKGQIPPATH